MEASSSTHQIQNFQIKNSSQSRPQAPSQSQSQALALAAKVNQSNNLANNQTLVGENHEIFNLEKCGAELKNLAKQIYNYVLIKLGISSDISFENINYIKHELEELSHEKRKSESEIMTKQGLMDKSNEIPLHTPMTIAKLTDMRATLDIIINDNKEPLAYDKALLRQEAIKLKTFIDYEIDQSGIKINNTHKELHSLSEQLDDIQTKLKEQNNISKSISRDKNVYDLRLKLYAISFRVNEILDSQNTDNLSDYCTKLNKKSMELDNDAEKLLTKPDLSRTDTIKYYENISKAHNVFNEILETISSSDSKYPLTPETINGLKELNENLTIISNLYKNNENNETFDLHYKAKSLITSIDNEIIKHQKESTNILTSNYVLINANADKKEINLALKQFKNLRFEIGQIIDKYQNDNVVEALQFHNQAIDLVNAIDVDLLEYERYNAELVLENLKKNKNNDSINSLIECRKTVQAIIDKKYTKPSKEIKSRIIRAKEMIPILDKEITKALPELIKMESDKIQTACKEVSSSIDEAYHKLAGPPFNGDDIIKYIEFASSQLPLIEKSLENGKKERAVTSNYIRNNNTQMSLLLTENKLTEFNRNHEKQNILLEKLEYATDYFVKNIEKDFNKNFLLPGMPTALQRSKSENNSKIYETLNSELNIIENQLKYLDNIPTLTPGSLLAMYEIEKSLNSSSADIIKLKNHLGTLTKELEMCDKYDNTKIDALLAKIESTTQNIESISQKNDQRKTTFNDLKTKFSVQFDANGNGMFQSPIDIEFDNPLINDMRTPDTKNKIRFESINQIIEFRESCKKYLKILENNAKEIGYATTFLIEIAVEIDEPSKKLETFSSPPLAE